MSPGSNHLRGPDRLRYGIIGTGMMGAEHIIDLQEIDSSEIIAFADPDPASLAHAQAIAMNKSAAAYHDFNELLARSDIDVVVIASPNYTHAAVAAAALRSGKHLLIEKPLCTTVRQCQDLIATERQTHRDGRVVQVGLEYRFMAPTSRLIEETRAGRIGDLKMIAIREHRFPFLQKVGDWNRFNAYSGGTLVEKCCHFFDLMNVLAGSRPLRVMASGAQDVNHLDERYGGEKPDILDNAFVIVEFENGIRASLDLCMFADASANEQEISVVGSAGKIEAFLPSAIVRHSRRSDGYGTFTQSIEPQLANGRPGMHHGATRAAHLAMQQAIRQGAAAVVDTDAGMWAVAVGQAAQVSIECRRIVEMAELIS